LEELLRLSRGFAFASGSPRLNSDMSENTLTALRGSQWANWLECLGWGAAILLFARLALEEDLTWVGWVTAGVAVVLLAVLRWPYGALFVLIAMSAMPVFFVEIFGWKARPEHFAAAIIAIAVAIGLALYKRRVSLNKLDYWILAYVAINFISSAFGSPAPAATLRWALQNSLAVLPYFLIRFLVTDLEALGKAFRILLGVGLAESAYGIFCYVSHDVLGSTIGMSIGQYLSDVAAPYGSMYEPNLFGAYSGCCAVLFLTLYVAGGQNRTGYLACFSIAALASVLSFSRAALFALVVAVTWVFWKARSGGRSGHRRLASIVLAAALILVVAASALGGVLRERFINIYYQGLAEETTISRFIVMEEALQEIPRHPLLGSGTASFNLSFDWARYNPEWVSDKTWIGNTPLRVLHDTGLLGLAAFLGFFVSVWWKIYLGLRGRGSQNPILVGLSAGTLLYAISFQLTDGSVLAFTWVHLGFLACAAILIKRPEHNMAVQGET
jgi:O-antigen ligase